KMDDPNITMEEYIRLEEEKARRHDRTFNWQTATFGKVKNYKDEDDHPIDFEAEFPAIVFDNRLTAIQSEPTVCPSNENELDFRISLDESDDEDYTLLIRDTYGSDTRFGVPNALISDRGTHFCNSQLEKALLRYGVTHRISTAYHPHTNGQTKVTNRAIKRILERLVGYNPKD
ncbi:reverse transcriptase domain-containing protein, partial [Tanacetum coccineum]